MGSAEIPLLGSCYPEPFQQSLQHAAPICCITLEPLLCPVSLLVTLTATCTFTCLSYPYCVGLWTLVSFFGSLLHAEWYNRTRCCSGYSSKCNTQQTACCKFGPMATLPFSTVVTNTTQWPRQLAICANKEEFKFLVWLLCLSCMLAEDSVTVHFCYVGFIYDLVWICAVSLPWSSAIWVA